MLLSAWGKSPTSPNVGIGSRLGETNVSSQVVRWKCLRWQSSGSKSPTKEVAEGRSSMGVNGLDEPVWPMVGVLRATRPKRGA